MEFLYGKLNKEVELQEYKGSNTDTISLYVDNTTHTITANYIGSQSSSNSDNVLVIDKDQLLTNEQLAQVYKNIELDDYISTKSILKEKENQTITGNLKIDGILNTDRLITSDNIIFKNYNNNYNAELYVDEKGNLIFTNYTSTRKLLGADNLVSNKFVYYNGEYLTTRYIQPTDILTTNYTPEKSKDLATKEYTDKVVRTNGNYGIVSTYDDFMTVTAWQGRRIHIIECDTEDEESHLDNPDNNPIGEEVNAINE